MMMGGDMVVDFKEPWVDVRPEHKLIDELIKVRKEKEMSQLELAERSGNKQQAISRIENKETSPTLKTLCRLLDVLGYEIKFKPKKELSQAELTE